MLTKAARQKDPLWHAKSLNPKPPSSREEIFDLRATVSILEPHKKGQIKPLILPYTHLGDSKIRDR